MMQPKGNDHYSSCWNIASGIHDCHDQSFIIRARPWKVGRDDDRICRRHGSYTGTPRYRGTVDPGRSSGDVHVVRRLQDVGCDDEGLAGFGGEMVTGSRLRFSCRGGCVQYELTMKFLSCTTESELIFTC